MTTTVPTNPISVGRTPLSRRTIAKGIAWTAPALVIASAAPAFAASDGLIWFEAVGLGCKQPGSSCEQTYGITKGYIVRVKVCSSFPYPVDVIIRDATVSLNHEPATLWQVTYPPLPSNTWSGTTVADPEGQTPDPKLSAPAATATGPECAIVDFAIAGEPSSQNVSISGSAPFEWMKAGADPADPRYHGTGTLTMNASATPPCDKCQIVGTSSA